jgi:hypothetical protein
MCFDSEEENKLEYTSIHASFKKLVETKLEKFIAEMGIDADTFMVACQTSHQKVHKSII